MGAYAAKGTTFTFASGQVLKVQNVRVSKNNNAVDITGMEDTEHEFTSGTPVREITISVFGLVSTISEGSTGTISILWGGTTNDTLGGFTYICTHKENGAVVDGAQTTDLTFKKYAGA